MIPKYLRASKIRSCHGAERFPSNPRPNKLVMRLCVPTHFYHNNVHIALHMFFLLVFIGDVSTINHLKTAS